MLYSRKNEKSDSKYSIAIVNQPLFIPFDLSADLTQIIICDLAYNPV